MFTKVFRRRVKPEFKVVCDSDSIVYPVDFHAPDYPYEQAFQEADAYVRKLPMEGVVAVSDLLRLQFYSLFKQATEGDINTDVKPPNMLRDWEGYWKVYGWRKCRGMTRERARDMYIDLLDTQIRKHCTFVWGAPVCEDRWGAFYDGVKLIQNLPKGGYCLPESLRAQFYALYKQAHVGDLRDFQKTCVARKEKKYKWLRARPSKVGFDQMRYDKWAALKGVSCEEAKRMYCKEMFKNAVMCGYVWAPPGTEDHLEVIGDQTSSKMCKKRADAGKDAERIERAAHLTIEESVEATGLKLSMLERLAMHSFLKEEEKQTADRKATEKAAELRRRGAAHSHTDPNKGILDASPRAEALTGAILTEEDSMETEDTDNDSRGVGSLSGSFVKGRGTALLTL